MGVYTQNLCRDGCVYAGLVLVWGRMYVGHYVRIGMKVYTRGLCMYGGGCVRRACVAMEMVRTWGLCRYRYAMCNCSLCNNYGAISSDT